MHNFKIKKYEKNGNSYVLFSLKSRLFLFKNNTFLFSLSINLYFIKFLNNICLSLVLKLLDRDILLEYISKFVSSLLVLSLLLFSFSLLIILTLDFGDSICSLRESDLIFWIIVDDRMTFSLYFSLFILMLGILSILNSSSILILFMLSSILISFSFSFLLLILLSKLLS
jgi:hypothetical protein